jgi:hypothetical protein
MGAGRPPRGWNHIDDLEGPENQKQRLRIILETVSGERTVREACETLQVSEARFHALRQQVLESALAGLTPGRPGRPRREEPLPPPGYLAELEEEVRDLKLDLEASRIQTELALVMPEVLKRGQPRQRGKKNTSEANSRRRKGRRRR